VPRLIVADHAWEKGRFGALFRTRQRMRHGAESVTLSVDVTNFVTPAGRKSADRRVALTGCVTWRENVTLRIVNLPATSLAWHSLTA